MNTTRAQPPAPLDLNADRPAIKSKGKSEQFVVRFPNGLRYLVMEAAELEGLSGNNWAVRVLVEAARNAIAGDFRSIPVGDRRTETAASPDVEKIEEAVREMTLAPVSDPELDETTYSVTEGAKRNIRERDQAAQLANDLFGEAPADPNAPPPAIEGHDFPDSDIPDLG